MEVGKGRFLSTLLPSCVLVKEWLDEGVECDIQHRVHQGVIHPDAAVRGLYTDYVSTRYKNRHLDMGKSTGLLGISGRYHSLKILKTPLEKLLLDDLLGEEVSDKVIKGGFALLGLHVWMAKLLKAQHRWLTPLLYVPGEFQLERALKRVPHRKAFRSAKSTLGLELARFKFGEVRKGSKWWKE
jgi:hypothetical protein